MGCINHPQMVCLFLGFPRLINHHHISPSITIESLLKTCKHHYSPLNTMKSPMKSWINHPEVAILDGETQHFAAGQAHNHGRQLDGLAGLSRGGDRRQRCRQVDGHQGGWAGGDSYRVIVTMVIWLVVWNMFYFPQYMGYFFPLTDIFQRGWNHQPE